MRHSILFLLLLTAGSVLSQALTPVVVTPLAAALNETSGLLMAGGTLWTHLDSGNPRRLYQVDTLTGAVVREVVVSNTANADWEDIDTDGIWAYVGDIGNNNGTRTDLRFFRFPLASLLDPGVDSVTVDTIRFTYADQVDFISAPNANNFDCEAFIALDDSLFLFTKNWVDSRTTVYALPAIPGDQVAERRDSLDAQGLITGASRDPLTGAIALLGYTNGLFVPFVWQLSGYTDHAFFDGLAVRHALNLAFVQMEGLAWNGPGTVRITNEESPFSPARLWQLELDIATPVATTTTADASEILRLVPNPAGDRVQVIGPSMPVRMRILSGDGKLMLEQQLSGQSTIDIGSFSPGPYVVEVFTTEGERRTARLVKQ